MAQVVPSWLGSVLLPNYPFTTFKLPVPIKFCVHLFHSYLSAHSTVLFMLDGIMWNAIILVVSWSLVLSAFICFQFRFKLTSWVQVILKRQLYIQISVAVKYVPMLVILVRPIIEVNKSLVLIHFCLERVPWTSHCTHIDICVSWTSYSIHIDMYCWNFTLHI